MDFEAEKGTSSRSLAPRRVSHQRGLMKMLHSKPLKAAPVSDRAESGHVLAFVVHSMGSLSSQMLKQLQNRLIGFW
jgi:hypothetical protein